MVIAYTDGKQLKNILCVEKDIVYGHYSDPSFANARGIAKCCEGKQETCGGYHWEWTDREENWY